MWHFVALHVDVLAHQLEFGFVVIEGYGFPVFFDVALCAVGSQTALVLVVLLVTVVAIAGGIAIFLARLMAVGALHLLFQVTALERVVGFVMVEFGVIEFVDFGIASLVVGMAFFTLLARIHTAVEAALFGEVLADFLVAIGTQLRLRVFIEFLVALLAILFHLGVALDDFSRHQQFIGLCLKWERKQKARQREECEKSSSYDQIRKSVGMNGIHMIERAKDHHIDQRDMKNMPPGEHSFVGAELSGIAHRIEVGRNFSLLFQYRFFHAFKLRRTQIALHRLGKCCLTAFPWTATWITSMPGNRLQRNS